MSEDNRHDAPERLELPLPVDWMSWEALKVLRRLHGQGHEAFLVGGCVRDLMLGIHPKDFDVATSARPREVKRAFRNCRLVGRRFRLAHILFSRGTIEVATFRKRPDGARRSEQTSPADDAFGHVAPEGWGGEPEWPDTKGVASEADPGSGRVRKSVVTSSTGEGTQGEGPEPFEDTADLLIHSDNVFGTPREDARRRDFTINGLFYDIRAGAVIDWVGGVQDLEDRVVRTIGDPEVRFREDPVRMLRAIRFASRLRFAIDPETWHAMCKVAPQIDRAAPPRLIEEVFRTLRSGGSGRAFRLMAAVGLLERFLVELVPYVDHGGRDERVPLPDNAFANNSGVASPRGTPTSPLTGREDARGGGGDTAELGPATTFALQSTLFAVDYVARRGVMLPSHLLLAVLAAEPVFRAADESEGGLSVVSIQEASADLFGVWGAALHVSRRDREQARLILVGCYKALQAMASGKRALSLTRKSYYADTTLLLGLATLAGKFPAASLESLARFVRPDENQAQLLKLALGKLPKRRGRRRRTGGQFRKRSVGTPSRLNDPPDGENARRSSENPMAVDIVEES